MKTTRLSRLLKMGTTLAKVSGNYALDTFKEKAQELSEKKEELEGQAKRVKAAVEIIRSMGELKGGLMKIGQMLSVTEDLILPKEISHLFKTLQKSAPAMPQEKVAEVFRQDFGKRPEEIFKSFDWNPLAAASIGQVHRAELKSGEEVAVKVQYPKIVQAIKGDLKNLKQLDQMVALLFPNRPNIQTTLQELKSSLLAECDYQKEVGELNKFRGLYAEEFKQIIIPRAYEEFSSTQILTMDYLQGDSFEETLHYSQKERDELGEILYQSFLFSFFQKRTLHTDPQNGNYLFGRGKIMMLDFGSTREFPLEFVEKYALLVYAVEVADQGLFRKAVLALDLLQATDDSEQFEQLFHFIKNVYGPYLEKGTYAVVDLNPIKFFKDFVTGLDLSRKSSPRREFLLLDRANLGIFTKLRDWQARVNWEEGRVRYRYDVSAAALEKYGKGPSS